MNSPNQLSFLPEDYLERKAQRRTNAICAFLFLVVMTAIGLAFTYTDRSMRRIEQAHAVVEREYTEAARRIEQVREMQEKQRQMAHQAELSASLLEKVPRSFLMAEITNGIPAGVSLLDLSMESRRRAAPAAAAPRTAFEQRRAELEKKAAPPAPAQPVAFDVTMKMTGIAGTDVQVAQFMRTLASSELLQDVNLVYTDRFQMGENTLRKFQIEMKLNPRADVQAEASAKRNRTTVHMDLN